MAPKKKAAPKKKEYKLDIFELLEAADRKDLNFYNKLTDDEKKEVSFIPLLKWVSSVKDERSAEHYLLMTNALINVGEPINSISRKAGDKNNGYMAFSKNHKELQWLLMALIGNEKRQQHQYIKGAQVPKSTTTQVDELILTRHPGLNNQELNLLKSMFDITDVENLAKDYGWPDKEIKELTNEFKKSRK
jgi:hypothetical protein